MPESRSELSWKKADQEVSGLDTGREWAIQVQREALPLVFVPGIMGSCLRSPATEDAPAEMRWNPSSEMWMWSNFSGASPARRKTLLVGDAFSPDFLEVAESDPPGDGFAGIRSAYHPFLLELRERSWEELGKVFEFPVYAVGYNWTDDSENAGKMLAQRIVEIIDECRAVTGLCDKAILITHSMGGIVARAAVSLAGAQKDVLGVIHGVQPVLGAPAAYWRIKGGFEGSWFGANVLGAQRVLGPQGPHVTAVLANIPGGLQLLPTKDYPAGWLTVTGDNPITLPNSDPYEEIYRVPAIVRPQSKERPSTNAYWGLVDPDLLELGRPAPPADAEVDPEDDDALAGARRTVKPWAQYLDLLDVAEAFHDKLGKQRHPETFCFHGTGQPTADVIELRTESRWIDWDPYRSPGFRGWFVDARGKDMQAVLQDPEGDGDATVPVASATALDQERSAPGHRGYPLEHEPAFTVRAAQDYTIAAIIALAKKQYEARG